MKSIFPPSWTILIPGRWSRARRRGGAWIVASGYIVLSTRYTIITHIKDDETLCRMNHLAALLLGKDTVLNNN